MAQVAFGLGGLLAAGPSGLGLGTVGKFLLTSAFAAVGGIIDQKVLFPAIFGSADRGRPAVPEDFSAQDGTPAPLAYGRTALVTGTVIWAGAKNVRTKSKTGETEITQDFAVAVNTKETERILKIWFNGRDVLTTNFENRLTQTVQMTFSLEPVPILGTRLVIEIAGTVSFNDLFAPPNSIEISGADAGNNGTHQLGRKEVDANGDIRYLTTSTTGTPQTVTATIEAGFQGGEEIGTRTFYKGTLTQAVDPVISADEGATTPAFRGTSYILFDNARLESLGGPLPVAKFLIEENPNRELDEVIEDLMLRSGYASSEFDVTDLVGIAFDGWSSTGPFNLRNVLNFFVLAYNLDIIDNGSKIIFRKHTNTVSRTLTAADIAYQPGPNREEFSPAIISDHDIQVIPKELFVHYISKELDWQRGTNLQIAQVGDFDTTEDVNLPFVLTDSEANKIAQRLLWQYQNERQNITITCSPKQIDLVPGDNINIPVKTSSFAARVEKVTIGSNRLLELRCVIFDKDTNTQVAVTDSLHSFLSRRTVPVQALQVKVLDIPAVFDEDVLNPVLYYAVYTKSIDQFKGAFVHISSDGINFRQLTSTAGDNVTGKADTVLATTTNFFTFDEVNTVDVTIFQDSLSSETEIEVLEDRVNMALLGTELIYFKTATVIGTKQYRLSGLLRGVRNTEDQVGTHASGEAFVLINSQDQNKVSEIPITFSDQGRNQTFSFVGVGGLPAEGNIQDIAIDLKVLKPFSPTDLQASRNGANDMTITWKRRSRAFGAEFDDGGTPLVDGVELYDIEILSAPGGSVVRTFEDVTTTSQVYTAAEQTTDGFTPGNKIDVKVYQVGPLYGRGKGEEQNI